MKLSIEELYKLAQDRLLSTVEIHIANDFYGNATILKKYAKLPPNYQIKSALEHGAYLGNDFWNLDIASLTPAIFIFAKARYPVLRALTNKAIFSIGPILSYAQHFLNDDSLTAEREKLGKNLLVFAGHSTHWVDCNYNIEKLCLLIEKWGKDFNTIRICLYWKDILRGHAKPYLEHGFECVTAGHIFDPLFLPRLKSIIELSTMTASNILGTHIGYCVLMNKPHFYYKDELEHTAQTEEILKRDTAEISPEIKKRFFQTFSKFSDAITPSQKELIEKYWGLNDIKSVEEMHMIFQATEDMYKKGHNFFMSNRDVLTEQAVDYLNQNKSKEALFLFENSIKVNDNAPWLGYGKAIALVQLGQTDIAIETLKNLLAAMPENQEAQQLLNKLSQINTAKNLPQSTFNSGKNFFGPVILSPSTLSRIATDVSVWQEILSFHLLLASDEYVQYLDSFYRECIKRFGSNWYYLDIVNVLYAASKTIQPRTYLEIGVRRGRSVCTVARGCPNVDIAAYDMWLPEYGGMENPGPEFVRSELIRHGHTGNISFINGDSHQTIPAFFSQNPQAVFDMITVDGDHSEAGALDDLKNVIPHLSVGGILVFDDIAHPAHPYLLNVWKKAMAMFPFLASFEFTELGYGVAFAIRKSE